MKSVAVVGAGPTGLVSARAALELGFSVTVVDPWIFESKNVSKLQNSPKFGNLAKKSYFGSFAMYEYEDSILSVGDMTDLPISGTVGGLSAVWGANILSDYQISSITNSNNQSSIDLVTDILSMKFKNERSRLHESPIASDRFERMFDRPQDRSSFSVQKSSLAIDWDACTRCGQCLTGCPQDAIFNASFEWRNLVNSGEVTLLQGYVDRVVIGENDDLKVELVGSDMGHTFDYIFLCAGSVATSALLLRSLLIPNHSELADTQVYYMPFFSIKGRKNMESRFALAQSFIQFKDDAGGSQLALYEASAETVRRAKQIVGPCQYLVPDFIWRRIIPGIGMVPSKFSGRLTLHASESGQIKLTASKARRAGKYIWGIYLKNFFRLFRRGILPLLPAVQVPNVGSSYHVGALTFDNKSLISKDGRIRENVNLFIADGSAIDNLVAGPVTHLYMINAAEITKNALGGSRDE